MDIYICILLYIHLELKMRWPASEKGRRESRKDEEGALVLTSCKSAIAMKAQPAALQEASSALPLGLKSLSSLLKNICSRR